MRTIKLMVALAGLPLLTLPTQAAEPSLGGACPVCLYEMNKVVQGKKEFQASFDRRTYYFPGEKQRDMFLANPTRYAPALAGDCTVCKVEMGARMPGKPEFTLKHDNRLYLFPSQKQLDMFKATPKKYANADIAFDCHCPVCLLDGNKAVLGKPEFTSIYDGLRYLFPGSGPKETFDANPARYAPALGGNCAVCLKDGEKLVAGSLKYGLFYKDRGYLLPSKEAREKFFANPARYADIDLANQGNCVVCQKIMGKAMPGKREHASIYKGKLFLFPGAKQKEMFESNPERFVSDRPTPRQESRPVPVPPANGKEVTFIGKTGCAGCDYGKRPLSDPSSLGLAVVSQDKVYIIERADRLYPGVYANRFDSLRVQGKGKVKKDEGQFIWIEPSALEQVR